MMYRTITTASAALILIASGVVHGLWTDRWTVDPAVLKAAADRLPEVPTTLGKWDGSEIEMTTDARLGLAGSQARRYVHRETGKVISIYLACGRPGHISIHTPDACYVADGYKEAELAHRFTIPGAGKTGAEFWTARFMRQRPDAQTNLRVFWAWRAASGWQAADNPRVAFAAEAVLHKLYVIRELAHPNEPADGDVCVEFMQELLPALEQRLFEK
jgi:hypothetical protein